MRYVIAGYIALFIPLPISAQTPPEATAELATFCAIGK